MMDTLRFSGFITVCKEYDSGDGLYLLPLNDGDINYYENRPLSEQLEDIKGKQVTVRYWTSDDKKNFEEAEESFIHKLVGKLYCDYGDSYSEYTGYLWTTDELEIGGHDLIKELTQLKGKYLNLEVEVYE